MKNPGQFQQGDVWLQRVESIPADAEPVNSVVLAEGEGHHLHRFVVAEDVEMFVKDGVRFARLNRESVIEHVTPDGRHGEHHRITVPAGDYQFGQVVEFDYLAEMARPVID